MSISLPREPFRFPDSLSMMIFELETNEELRWISQNGISRDKKPFLYVDPEEKRRKQAKRVLPYHMRICIPIVVFVAVLYLETSLVRRTIFRGLLSSSK